MDVFYVGIATLGVVLFIFYLIFFGFVYYWHAKKATYVVVPLLFAFQIFVRCLLAVAIVTLILQYVPQIL